MMTIRSLLKPALAALLLAVGGAAGAESLDVAVAASVQFAFGDLQAEFKKISGQDLKPVFGASGKFATQIMNGAPFDVFLSADMEFPEKLFAAGFASAKPQVYARGALVVWSTKEFGHRSWSDILTAPEVARIAVADPATAPYGRAAMDALHRARLDVMLKPKLVFGESIAQIDQFVYSGAADAGLTAKSVVLAQQVKGEGKWVDVPQDFYDPIEQGVVVLQHGQENHARLARQFVDFLASESARAIFARYGYVH